MPTAFRSKTAYRINNSPTGKRKTVLFISYDGLTDPLGQSQILPYLAALSDATAQICILSCEKADNYRRNREVVERAVAEHSIEWTRIAYTKRPPILSTIYDLFKLRRAALAMHDKFKFSIVHCRSYIPALIGLALQRKGVHFLFDMRGFWADEKVDGRLWNLSNPLFKFIYNFFKRKELQFLKKADHTVVLTHVAKKEILRWPGCADIDHKISVIPCCVDLQLFNRSRISRSELDGLRSKLGITGDDDVFVYLGSIGTWSYMLDEMMTFFARRLRKSPSAKFLFITHGDPQKIRACAHAVGVPEARIAITAAQRHEVPLYASLASYGIFFVRPSYSKTGMSPTKQGELMALGLPVICNSGVGDTDMIVRHFKSGVLVEQFDDEAYDRAAEAMNLESFSNLDITAGAATYFSLEKGVASYRTIYNRLSTGTPRGKVEESNSGP